MGEPTPTSTVTLATARGRRPAAAGVLRPVAGSVWTTGASGTPVAGWELLLVDTGTQPPAVTSTRAMSATRGKLFGNNISLSW